MNDAEILKAQCDAHLQTLRHIASLAHEGGPIGSEVDVLTYIRMLTKPHFATMGAESHRLYRLGNAVGAAERME
jgi:hypothetical protein